MRRRGSLVDRLHPDGHRDTELGRGDGDALDDLGGVGADLAAEGQLDGRVPLDGLQPAAVVVGAEHLLHPGAGRRGDVASTVEHLRDRGDRDTRGRGHRGQRGAGFVVDISRPLCCGVPSLSAWCSTRTGRVQPTVVADDAGGTRELDGDPSAFVRGRGADDELHLARLDDPVQRRRRCRRCGRRGCRRRPRPSPRLEVDAGEADQLPHGPGDPGHRVVQVDLDDLVTGPVAGVRHHRRSAPPPRRCRSPRHWRAPRPARRRCRRRRTRRGRAGVESTEVMPALSMPPSGGWR